MLLVNAWGDEILLMVVGVYPSITAAGGEVGARLLMSGCAIKPVHNSSKIKGYRNLIISY
jgi:hypothetical protein